MTGDKKALDAAKTLVQFCKEQRGCQNCIFHRHAGSHWECQLDLFELADVLSNIEAKKKTQRLH